ncbi:MAG: hypothetical protein JW941_12525 [Candidatus Coatesbacteria bacterium]|nr:hypothetical protein [Candidatus Coatesbacteria bacterium]
MKKSKIFLSVLLLIAVMFFLSFLITILASLVIPPKNLLPGEDISSSETRGKPEEKEASGSTSGEYLAEINSLIFSPDLDASRRRDVLIEQGAAAFPGDELLQLLLREVRLESILSKSYVTDDELSKYEGYISSIEDKSPDARIDYARALIHVDRYRDAISKLRELLALVPDSVRGNYYLGESFARELRLRDSARHLRIALEHCGDYRIAGELLKLVGKAEGLAKVPVSVISAREMLPNLEIDMEGLMAIGNLLLWLDDPALAGVAFTRAISMSPESADAHIGLARSQFEISADIKCRRPSELRLNSLIGAAEHLEKAAILNKGNRMTLLQLAEELRALRQQKDGIIIYSAVAEYLRDTGQLPGKDHDWLLIDSEGKAPQVAGDIDRDSGIALASESLVTNREKVEGWKGPYLLAPNSDSWGRSYMVRLWHGDETSSRILTLSAGPNGILETPGAARSTEGDDLGLFFELRASEP